MPFGTSSASRPSSMPRSGAPGSWRSWPSLPGWWPMTGRWSPSGLRPPSTTSGGSCPVPAVGRCWPGPGWPRPGLPTSWEARPRAARAPSTPLAPRPSGRRRAGCAATSSPSWRTRARAWRPAARRWWRRCGGGDPGACRPPSTRWSRRRWRRPSGSASPVAARSPERAAPSWRTTTRTPSPRPCTRICPRPSSTCCCRPTSPRSHPARSRARWPSSCGWPRTWSPAAAPPSTGSPPTPCGAASTRVGPSTRC